MADGAGPVIDTPMTVLGLPSLDAVVELVEILATGIGESRLRLPEQLPR